MRLEVTVLLRVFLLVLFLIGIRPIVGQDLEFEEPPKVVSWIGEKSVGLITGKNAPKDLRRNIIDQAEKIGSVELRTFFVPKLDRNIVVYSMANAPLSEAKTVIKHDQSVLVYQDKGHRLSLELIVKMCRHLPYDTKSFDGKFDFQREIRGANRITGYHTVVSNAEIQRECFALLILSMSDEYMCDVCACAEFRDAKTNLPYSLWLLYYADNRLTKDKELREVLLRRDVKIGDNGIAYFVFDKNPSKTSDCLKFLNSYVAQRIAESKKKSRKRAK